MTKLVIIKWHSGNKVSSERTGFNLYCETCFSFFFFNKN